MSRTDFYGKIIVALDVAELEQAQALVAQLQGRVGAFKIGKQLFTRYGPEAVRAATGSGAGVFLDLKYHDIPATVAKAAREVCRLGAGMFTVHALGGKTMLQEAVQAARAAAEEFGRPRPLLLAVTVLTSMDAEELARLGLSGPVQDTVVRLAVLAREAGADGVVASPREIEPVRRHCGKECIVVTPGIRPAYCGQDDQKRTMTPEEALRAGADYLVIGRPVTAAPEPAQALQRIVDEIDTAVTGAPEGGSAG